MSADGAPTVQFARLPVALIKAALEENPTTTPRRLPGDALAVLVYLHSQTVHRTGEPPKDAGFHYADAAEWTGFSVSTVRAHVAALERHGLLRTWRVFRGLRFRILGITSVSPGKCQPVSTYKTLVPAVAPPPAAKRRPASTSEELVLAGPPPSVGSSALPIDSEDSERGGGKTPAVVDVPPLAPSLGELDEEIEAGIKDAERLLNRPVNDEVRRTLRSALRQPHIRRGRRRRAAQDIAQTFVDAKGRFSDNASYWGQRLLNWVDPNRPVPRLNDAAPRPAPQQAGLTPESTAPPIREGPAGPPPDPARSQGAREAARARLAALGLDKPHPIARAHFGMPT